VVGLQNKVPVTVTLKLKKFKVFFIFPLVLHGGFYIHSFSAIMSSLEANNPEPSPELVGGLFAVIVPLHLFGDVLLFIYFLFCCKNV